MTDLVMVSLTFIGAQVAHKAANGAIQAVWDSFSARFLAHFNKTPAPSESAGRVKEVVAADKNLSADLAHVLRESSAMRRTQLLATALRGARILWIDDWPENNAWERILLRELGVEVTAVTHLARALECLQMKRFDVVLSDIAREDGADEGLRTLPQVRAAAAGAAVIFYVGNLDPARGIPPGAAGITNHPEELLHLILDALERRRL